MFAAWTGQAEISLGAASLTATVNAIGVSNGRHNGNAGNLYAGNVVVGADLVPGGSDDTNIRSWIATQGSYSL